MLFKRSDGTLAKDLPLTRLMMPVLMRTRTEATVYFEQELDVTDALRRIDAFNQAHPETKITIFHVYMWALTRALSERPRLNRFVSGGRIYDRQGIWLSFAAKKRKLDDTAALVTVKRKLEADSSLEDLAKALHAEVKAGRSDKPRTVDKELSLLFALPFFLLRWVWAGMGLLDRWNLLPAQVIEADPLFTSVFVANLGSVGLDAAFHHLYEWGNCPFFAALGRTRQVQTEAGPRSVATVRYAFDERIDDGLSCAHALARVKALVEQGEQALSSPAPTAAALPAA